MANSKSVYIIATPIITNLLGKKTKALNFLSNYIFFLSQCLHE